MIGQLFRLSVSYFEV